MQLHPFTQTTKTFAHSQTTVLSKNSVSDLAWTGKRLISGGAATSTGSTPLRLSVRAMAFSRMARPVSRPTQPFCRLSNLSVCNNDSRSGSYEETAIGCWCCWKPAGRRWPEQRTHPYRFEQEWRPWKQQSYWGGRRYRDTSAVYQHQSDGRPARLHPGRVSRSVHRGRH